MASTEVNPSQEEFRFLLLGKTGSGKSMTGNTILGQELFDADVSFDSVTSECTLRRSRTDVRMIEIMDSPGLFDTTKPHEEISALVMQAIACMHPGPDAVFYVMKVGRFTDEEDGVYRRLKALLDDQVTKYMIVLFTHGDMLKGKDIKVLLDKAPDKMKEVLKECGNRYVVMDNMHREDRAQVERLLQSVRSLRQANDNKPYTCPKYASVGEKMEEEVNRRMQAVEAQELEHKRYVQELNHNLQQSQERAEKERQQFLDKEKEREAAMAAQKQETDAKLTQLAADLKAKNASAEEQKQQMDALRKQIQEEGKRQREAHERQRKTEMDQLRNLVKEKDASLKKVLESKNEETRRMVEMHQREMDRLKDQIATSRTAKRKGSDDCTIL